MELSVSVLLLYLRHLKPEAHIRREYSGKIRSVLYYESGQDLVPGCAYLCSAAELSQHTDAGLWLCPWEADMPAPDAAGDFILFRGAEKPVQIMNAYARVQMELTEWDHTMRKAILADCSLEELIYLGEQQICNPIVVCDSSLTVICHSVEAKRWPEVYESLTKTGYPILDVVKYFTTKEYMREMQNSENAFIRDSILIPGKKSILRRIMFRDKILGYATIFSENDFHEGCIEVAEIFFHELEAWFAQNQKEDTLNGYTYELFLAKLVSGYCEENKKLRQRIEWLGLAREGNFQLILVECESVAAMPTDYVLKRLTDIGTVYRPFTYNERLYILCNQQDRYLVVQQLREYMSFYTLKCYISDLFHRLVNIYAARLQCELAQEIAQRLKLKKEDVFYPELSSYAGPLLIGKQLNGGELILDERHRRLQEWDAETNSRLCETVCAYLRNECDLNRTAAQLYFHRNTVNTHIRKATEIMQCDLGRYEDRSALLQSFLMEELFRNKED